MNSILQTQSEFSNFRRRLLRITMFTFACLTYPWHWIKFSLQDLFSWRSAWLTSAVVITVGLVCGILMSVMGLVRGAEAVGNLRAEKTPLARRLLVGDINVMRRKITSTVLDELQGGVDNALQMKFPGQSLREISPFQIVNYGWKRNGSSVGAVPPKNGRTLHLAPGQKLTDHPLLMDQKDEIRYLTKDDSSRGVIICPKLLNLLGVENVNEFQDQTLTTYLNGDPENVPVLAILAKNLPENVYFIVPEHYDLELKNREPNIEIKFLITGPLNPEWDPKLPMFDTICQKVFEPSKFAIHLLDPGVDEYGAEVPPRLRIDFTGEAEPLVLLYDWKAKLMVLQEELDKQFQATGSEPFLQYNTQDQIPKPLPIPDNSQQAYDYVELYFKKVVHIPVGLNVARNHPAFKDCSTCVNSVAADQLLKIQQENQAMMDLAGYFQWVLYALLTCSLGIIQVLRSALKATEAGMLKAIGVGWAGLILVVSIQVGLIWSLGAASGIATGYWLGPTLAHGFYSDPLERQSGFIYLLDDGWNIFLLSGAISVGITLLATWNWHFRCAATLLNNR